MTETPPPLAAGDVGVVHGLGRNGATTEAKVVKVGRRWADVVRNDERGYSLGRFDKVTGLVDGKGYQSQARFYTEARWEHAQRVRTARDAIRAAGLDFRLGFSSGWTEADVLALADWLEEHGPAR